MGKEEKVIYPDYWIEGTPIQSYEEQIFDKTKFRYSSNSHVSGIFHDRPTWVKEALSYGFIPYIGNDNFIHWKLEKK